MAVARQRRARMGVVDVTLWSRMTVARPQSFHLHGIKSRDVRPRPLEAGALGMNE
jgi:hypothetical protein